MDCWDPIFVEGTRCLPRKLQRDQRREQPFVVTFSSLAVIALGDSSVFPWREIPLWPTRTHQRYQRQRHPRERGHSKDEMQMKRVRPASLNVTAFVGTPLPGAFTTELRHGNRCVSVRTTSQTRASSFVGRPARLPPSVASVAPAAPRMGMLLPLLSALPSIPALASGITSGLLQFASAGTGFAILGAIVFIHECGHYFAARWQGIRVKNFSIGFGPALYSFTPPKSETEFTIRALPLGGYVAFPEHTSIDEESGEVQYDDDPNLLQNRPVLDRAIVISAGVIANLILAWSAICVSVAAIGLPEYTPRPGVVIASIVDSSGPGANADVRPGDVILTVNGKKVEASMESASSLASQIRTSEGRQMVFTLSRDGDEIVKRIRPKVVKPNGEAAMGVQLVPNAELARLKPGSVPQLFKQTNTEFGRLSSQTFEGLASIVTNFKESSTSMSGPIGVVAMGASLATNEQAALLTFCAVVSLNLAIINSLPLPALDGGQMTFLVIEALKGSPVSSRIQDTVNRTALLVFLAFSGVLFYSDLEKLSITTLFSRLFS